MPTATKRPRTRERMVKFQIVEFNEIARTATGELREAGRTALRGELINLSPAEESRLEALGALGAQGQSIEDLDREAEELHELYVRARQNATAPEVSY